MGGSSPKNGLGRSLGVLMQGRKPAEPARSTSSRDLGREDLSPGMAILIRGANGAMEREAAREEEAFPVAPVRTVSRPQSTASIAQARSEPDAMVLLLRISLICADVLLCALAGWLALALKPLGFWETTLCCGAIITGAWLSWLALKLRL